MATELVNHAPAQKKEKKKIRGEKSTGAKDARIPKKRPGVLGVRSPICFVKKALPVRRCGDLSPRPKRERLSRNMGGRPIFVSPGPRLRP